MIPTNLMVFLFLVTCGLAMYAAARGGRRSTLVFAVGLFYVLFFGAVMPTGAMYAELAALDQAAIVSRSMLCGFMIAMTFMLCFVSKHDWFYHTALIAGCLGQINMLCVIGQWIWGVDPFYRTGLFNNSSLSMSFTILTLPFILQALYLIRFIRRTSSASIYLVLGLNALGLIAAQASMPVLMFAVILSVLFQNKRVAVFFTLLAGVSLISSFTSLNGRYAVWQMVLDLMKDQPSWVVTGAGLGSFSLWFPKYQQINHFMIGSWFTTAHNDYMQILFELGAVGLFLYLLLALALYLLAKDRFYRMALLALLVGNMGNSLLYNLPTALVAVALIFLIFNSRPKETPIYDLRS